MSQPMLTVGLLALLLCACTSSSDPVAGSGSGSGSGPDIDAGSDDATAPGANAGAPAAVPAGPSDESTVAGQPTRFLSIPDGLEQSAHHAAELTREACLVDYDRLASLLGTSSSVERFHRIDGGRVDVEWIEPGAVAVATDGPVGIRQGAGVVMTGRRSADGATRCDIAAYETYGFTTLVDIDRPETAVRIDAAMLACAPDSAHPQVSVENSPLFTVDDGEGVHAYGSIGRTYTLAVNGVPFRTQSVRAVSRQTLDPDDDAVYVVECTTPAALPDGGSILLAPLPTSAVDPLASSGAFVGRPWQATARTAQDIVDAHGVLALRDAVERAVSALGPIDGDLVDVACPLGGSATLAALVETDRQTHRYAFAGCMLDDGTQLDGFHDSDLERQDEGDSVRRSREERFDLQVGKRVAGMPERLAASGTLSDALTGKRADACGLLAQERVLRIDVPTMRIGAVSVSALAIEDITNARIRPGAGAGCGSQIHEHAFSDSARVEQTLADGAERRFTVNRTGSVILDQAGLASSSGRDALIRIYDPVNDDSLEIAPDFSRTDGATITIDQHPGQVRLADSWRFVDRRATP